MIIDLDKFVAREQKYWNELRQMVIRLEGRTRGRMSLSEARRLHYLYERATADLSQLETFASEPQQRFYLEGLVARAYSQIHEARRGGHRLRPLRWFFGTFPRAFRRHVRAFWLSLAVTLVGCAFGAFAVSIDPDAKRYLLPFGHGEMDPTERVEQEEQEQGDRLQGQKSGFAAMLMTHNTRVSIQTMALGMTWGVMTIVMLFYNGVVLGGVVLDYVRAGQTQFLVGWLLPHGSIEIPAILLAGQAGLVLGGALIGWGDRTSLRGRLRKVAPDLVTLIFGVAIMLVWAGIVEAFLSQYHEPVIPYWLKISFGGVELVLLILLLSLSGRRSGGEEPATP